MFNPATQETSAKISVSIETNHLAIPPVEIPIGQAEVKHIDLYLGGPNYRLEYTFGTLDEIIIITRTRAKKVGAMLRAIFAQAD